MNPTGYTQLVDELQGGAVTRTYSYGLERISEKQASGMSFYGYDGDLGLSFGTAEINAVLAPGAP